MKQLLFLVIALLFIGSQATKVLANTDSQVIHLEEREKPKKTGTEQMSPVSRSQVLQPVYAHICNQVLSVNFPYEVPSATISVTNLSTGEVIYSDTYASPSQISFDLSQEASGEYYLEIVFDDFCIYGQFTL